MYARISLSLQNHFESKHAQALWELCMDYLGSGREYGETPFISVEQFKKLDGGGETQYVPEFKVLNQGSQSWRSRKSTAVSDLQVTVDYQRKGRKVEAMKFKIRGWRCSRWRTTGNCVFSRSGGYAGNSEAAQGGGAGGKRCMGCLAKGLGVRQREEAPCSGDSADSAGLCARKN